MRRETYFLYLLGYQMLANKTHSCPVAETGKVKMVDALEDNPNI
jgi:hypothetical protein